MLSHMIGFTILLLLIRHNFENNSHTVLKSNILQKSGTVFKDFLNKMFNILNTILLIV